jgi:hypothetical protein
LPGKQGQDGFPGLDGLPGMERKCYSSQVT